MMVVQASSHRRGKCLPVSHSWLLLMGDRVYKLSRSSVERVEVYSGRLIDELTQDDLERAILHLGIVEEEIDASDFAAITAQALNCCPPAQAVPPPRAVRSNTHLWRD